MHFIIIVTHSIDSFLHLCSQVVYPIKMIYMLVDCVLIAIVNYDIVQYIQQGKVTSQNYYTSKVVWIS